MKEGELYKTDLLDIEEVLDKVAWSFRYRI